MLYAGGLRRSPVASACLLAAVLALAFLTDDTASTHAWGAPTPLNTNAASDSKGDAWPQVTTDGGGNWVAVWTTYENLDDTIGFDADIAVARSTDNGDTWSPPVPLNANAASDSRDDVWPQVATDGAGNWVAVWTSTDSLDGTIGLDHDILVARSTDNGATWIAPIPLNTNAASDSGDDFHPQVATDDGSNWVALWYSNDSLGGTIGTDHDIWVARSTNNGAGWTAPAALNTNAASDAGHDFHPQVTTDGGGNWVVVWESRDSLGGTIGTDGDILVARSTDNGTTWTDPAALNTNAATDGTDDYAPQVATDRDGNYVGVWYSSCSLGGTIGSEWDILVSRSTDNGTTWTDPAALNTNAATDSGLDFAPQVTNGAGDWMVVWTSTSGGFGGIGTDYDILVARSTDNGATWIDPTALNTNAASDSGYDFEPQATTDGEDNWVGVWYTEDSLGGTIGTDADILYSTCSSLDLDCDAILNESDNCPLMPNPDQTNTDVLVNPPGDEFGDACDEDDDNDAWNDGDEALIGTDSLDNCPDDLADDAWPPDIDNSTEVDILDVLWYKLTLSGPYDPRYDLDANGEVNILDVLLYKPVLGASCANP